MTSLDNTSIINTRDVVLAVDTLECFHILQKSTASKGNVTKFELPPTASPVVHTLVAFAGSTQQLQVPKAIPVFYGVLLGFHNFLTQMQRVRESSDHSKL